AAGLVWSKRQQCPFDVEIGELKIEIAQGAGAWLREITNLIHQHALVYQQQRIAIGSGAAIPWPLDRGSAIAGMVFDWRAQRTQLALDTGHLAACFIELMPDVRRSERAEVCALSL